MVIFAMLDFLPANFVVLHFLFVGALIFPFVYGGIFLWSRIAKSSSPLARKLGVCLLVASGCLPLFCCLGPTIAARLTYGSFLLVSNRFNRIAKGMSIDEVTAILGSPHDRSQYNDGKSEHWFYYFAPFAYSFVCVDFGPDGRVISIWDD